ncbi:hypothetical protein FOZ62_002735, partial [Perkinsus olseni]
PFGARPSSGGFGAFGASQSSSSSPFGGAPASSSAGGFGAFGAKAASPSPFGSAPAAGGGGFGAFGSGGAAPSSGSGFGAFGATSSSSAPQTGSGFGGGAQKPGPFGSTPSTGGGLGAFGSTPQSSSSGFGAFGGGSTQSASGSGAFGGTSSATSGSSGFGAFGSSSNTQTGSGFGAFGGGQASTGFGAFGGAGGGSQPQKDGNNEDKAAPAKEESAQREKAADGTDQATKKEGDRREDGKASAAHSGADKKEGKEEESPSPVVSSSNAPSLGDARLVSRVPASEVTPPAEPDRTSVEDSQKRTEALLEKIAKDADDGGDSREARALFSEVEKDLEQLEAFMAEARRSPCKAASQVDLNNEVWTQLRKSVDSLTEVANEETLKQLDEIQRKNYALNAQLNEEMLSEDKEPSEVVVELRQRCKDISGRIDEAYGACKKALFMRRGRRQSGGSRAPPSPEVPPAPRVPIRPRPSVIVDGPTMPASLLAPPARRRQEQRKSGGGSALGRLAQASPQSSTVNRSRPTPPALRIQPEENVDSLRATVRRMRNPLRRRT